MQPFDRFGLAHGMVFAATAASAIIAVRAARGERSGALLRIALAFVLAMTMLAFLAIEALRGTLTALDFLPFHLCDFAVLLAIFALITLRQRAAELLYFLAFAELLALLTPDVEYAFPHPHTFVFFVLHGATVVSAFLLTFGCRLVPQKGAVVRALVFLNVYAAFAALVNLALDTNFLYLRRKPTQPSPLDWMGSWPWYLVTAEAFAAVLFFVVALPFRWKRRDT